MENGGRDRRVSRQPPVDAAIAHRSALQGATEETVRCYDAPAEPVHAQLQVGYLSKDTCVDLPVPTPAPRNENGRFATGNPGGPGRPKGRGQELQRAAQEAITPEHVATLIRVALRQGLQGNLTAIRVVLDRVCGRAPEAASESAALDIALPTLRTGPACAAAVDKIAAAVMAGTIDDSKAKLLIDIVQARMKAIDLTDYAERLAEMERQLQTVDLSRR